MNTFCSIDFGTSNSTLGIYKDNKAILVELENGNKIIPSAMFYEKHTDKVVFGTEALEFYKNGHEGRLLRTLKSILGTWLMQETTQINGKQVHFLSVIEAFLKHIKETAEKEYNITLDSVVLGRPVHFVDDNKEKDKEAQNSLLQAAKNVGFKNVEFQYEPIAASLKYEQSLNKEETVLIIDIGGGTSDISVVKLSPERAKKTDRSDDCLANTGVHIGGTDFDANLNLQNVMPLLGYGQKMNNGVHIPNNIFTTLSTWHKINFAYSRKFLLTLKDIKNNLSDLKLFNRLEKVVAEQLGFLIAMKVEESKIELSNKDRVIKDFGFIEGGLEVDFSKEDLSKAINKDIKDIIKTADKCIKKAKLKTQDIDSIFLTGGSSQMRIIKDAVSDYYKDIPIHNQDALSSVAEGLIIDAKNKFLK